MRERLATFRGRVTCTRAARVPGLTLSGTTAERAGELTSLAFSGAAPHDLPEVLQDAVVEEFAGGQYHISSAPHEWLINASAAHLHREIAAEFYRAIPPRPAPWTKRVFWKIVLTLAASRAGLAALRALRR